MVPLRCRNTINGRLYKEDPVIFAWDLINEPRCDCFPEKIPAPPELVSCRPECAGKVQVYLLKFVIEFVFVKLCIQPLGALWSRG